MRQTFILLCLAVALITIGCPPKSNDLSLNESQVYENVNINYDVIRTANKVKLQTSMGDIVIEMQRQAAPNTVNNFLRYVVSGFYDGTLFHRVSAGFVIQGGGLTAQMREKQTYPPIKNEFNINNTRGTVAMAKLGGDPDSATSQFFISIDDNRRILDGQNGGFTVFGKVVEGMDVVDRIASVRVTRRNGMDEVPVEPVIIISAAVLPE